MSEHTESKIIAFLLYLVFFGFFGINKGNISAADRFEPKYAMLLQNRDSVRIPLPLEALPTPKEFRDAIESLSPEQQRFAKAYRAMQVRN